MNYRISYKNPLTHLVDIELSLTKTGDVVLQLPAWRPGRYELQNYAANIKQFHAFDQAGNVLSFVKISRNQWKIENSPGEVTIHYQYYAYQMDAGGCWLDEEQLYLNFICCLMYEPSQIGEACKVELDLPSNYEIACGMPKIGHTLKAVDFYHLADSPMIASAVLSHFSFTCQNIPFHIWIQGKNYVEEEKIVEDFRRYTETQLAMMNDFPETDYHYLFQFLPYRHYHGVEHRNSTVITLGPSEAIREKSYSDLVGISSHELFHAWNIIKIRPVEMLPYDFTKENYFPTGFVAEGFTTYYGDLFLVRSKVFSVEEYFEELNTSLKRHFEHSGNFNLSLAESSLDLWVDGYTAGIPDRKVSIYVKGCIAALILDLEIRSKTNQLKSLDDLLRKLWEDFGKKQKGYSVDDIKNHVTEIAGQPMGDFFAECIFGHTDMKERLRKALQTVGCLLVENPSAQTSEKTFGFRTTVRNNRLLIESIAPGSPAETMLSKDDEIVEINGKKLEGNVNELFNEETLILGIQRWGRGVQASLKAKSSQNGYYPVYTIELNPEASETERTARNQWLMQ